MHHDDEEDEQEEEEQVLDHSFILRLPEGVAARLRSKMSQLARARKGYEKTRKHKKHLLRMQHSLENYIRIEPAVDPTTLEPLRDERYHVFIDKKCYPAKVFYLPCVTETYASADTFSGSGSRSAAQQNTGDLTKSGDIGEVLVVHDAPRSAEHEQMDWTWTEDPDLVYTKVEAARAQNEAVHRTLRKGLTHPANDVYAKRWAGSEYTNGWYPLKPADTSSFTVGVDQSGIEDMYGGSDGGADAPDDEYDFQNELNTHMPPLSRTDIEDMCRILTDNFEVAVEYTDEFRALPWDKDTVRIYDSDKMNYQGAAFDDDNDDDEDDFDDEGRGGGSGDGEASGGASVRDSGGLSAGGALDTIEDGSEEDDGYNSAEGQMSEDEDYTQPGAGRRR